MSVKIEKISSNLDGIINIKGSKSISNRLLIMSELANSEKVILNLSSSDDTRSLQFYLDMINNCEVSGIPMVIDSKNAGTVARFLTAFLVFREGTWLLTGDNRMKSRPITGLVDGLLQLGANITYIEQEGYLPVKIVGQDILGGIITIDPTLSSQFVTAIMMIGPYLDLGLTIKLNDKPVSLPYIVMTQKLMQSFGVSVTIANETIVIKEGNYSFTNCTVEPDWSSASYWYETVALSNKSSIFIPGLKKDSIQGDSVLPEIFEKLGVKTDFFYDGIRISNSDNFVRRLSYDFGGCPDIVPAVMATCTALGIEAEFINIDHLMYKESNRLETLALELGKTGAVIEKRNNVYELKVTNIPQKDMVFNTHNDHRLAMCLAPLVLRYDTIKINEPEVVNKSYPEFWDDFKKLNFASIN